MIKLLKKMTLQNIPSRRFVNLSNSNMKESYQEAVNCVNSLQSNFSYIQDATNRGVLPHSATHSMTIAETQKFLLRSGVSLNELDKLSVIHVAGTKGKGSTCAFVESILRQHNYKTGFYSSPHLIAMRERIRINGKPLEEEIFAKYVIKIYKTLLEKREHPDDMPAYFRFLTIVAFHVFLAEKVDVGILEVGIGGEYDCTNIVRNTPIVGITSLGMDHEKILGDTIEKIAWQKAGIMKNGSWAFTVSQPENAMHVLKERSKEKMCKLTVVPNFEDYWNGKKPDINLTDIHKINASLAIQLAHQWMLRCGNNKTSIFTKNTGIDNITLEAIKTCKWPGRNQILKSGKNTFYLDGAHTVESLELCSEWFKSVIRESQKRKVLIYNSTGNRDLKKFMKILLEINFNEVIFSPNVASDVPIADHESLNVNEDEQLKRCLKNKEIWIELQQNNFDWTPDQKIHVVKNIAEAFHLLPADEETHVLITGSLHLIGAVLTLVDPNLEQF